MHTKEMIRAYTEHALRRGHLSELEARITIGNRQVNQILENRMPTTNVTHRNTRTPYNEMVNAAERAAVRRENTVRFWVGMAIGTTFFVTFAWLVGG